MESGRKNEQVILLALLLTLAACRATVEEPARPSSVPDDTLLQAGDLVYRFGSGVYSGYFRDFSQRDKRFSHAGIVATSASGGPTLVVHAEADDITGQGGVRMEPLSAFLKEASDWAVYRVKSDEKTRSEIANCALRYSRLGIPFDLEFDANDPSAFYCTELVMHCVNDALGENRIRPNTLLQGKQFVALDDTYLNDWTDLITKNTESR